jgi:hypothetical protein
MQPFTPGTINSTSLQMLRRQFLVLLETIAQSYNEKRLVFWIFNIDALLNTILVYLY